MRIHGGTGEVADETARSSGMEEARSGAGDMVLSAFCFSVMSLMVKLAGTRIPSQEVVFVRAVISLAMAYVLVIRARVGNWGHRKGLLVLRGWVGFLALSCFFYGIIHLPLADATVIQYTNPVWTAWLGWWLLGEALTAGEAVLSGAGLLGVLLIARPTVLFGGVGAARLDPFAVGVALAGALFSASAYVSVRKLSRTEHPLMIVFYFTLVTVPASLPGALAGAVMPRGREWALMVGVGVMALLGQVFLTRGLQREPAGRATAIGYAQILFAATWGMAFFDEWPDALSLAGAALVLVSVVVLARRRGRPDVRAARAEEGTAEAV
ncbi:DMT family transporter [Longimicrobium sp.]|uniref:DMT family transporter n=1 Tax=Longimicrobium sp. TaxID=2029185 RepID=UPI002BF6683B|nr:DMT family transporter [Longimicrobium sp.]HSU15640.1 DMT family transporter [Longimicrobium sp.]